MRTMFEDTAERVLGDLVTPELLMAAETGVWPEALWCAVEENGLGIAAAPESTGGIGANWHDAFVLVRAAGRHCAPVPLAETILSNFFLGQAGVPVLPGPVTFGLGVGGLQDGYYSGTLDGVPWGASSSSRVLTIVSGEDPALVLLDCSAAAATRQFNVAREPRDQLVFKSVMPLMIVTLGQGNDPEILRLGGAMIRSAQIVGALERLLDVSIDYANQRVQFGRAIGKFQAIQHQLAMLAEQTAMASAAAETAFALSLAAPSPTMIASAKAVAGQAAGQGAAIAHAVLGAIGFTYEHSLHFTTRRLWSWRSEFGSQAYWARKIGQSLCSSGGDDLWHKLTSAGAGDEV